MADEGTDWPRVYRDNADAVCALAEGLGEEQLATDVPATPSWTVRHVVAHLAGGGTDALTGRMDDAPSPAWTARHVAERVELPVSELTEEIRRNRDALAASVAGNPRPALVWDIAVHHSDLHEALGLGIPDEHFWRPVLDGVAPMMLGRAGIDAAAVAVAPYELFRALFSRRSRAQMAAWGGAALTPEQLDGLCVFGPREDDQPIPA
jgi:uncharacterized protein (TIGR03083 family)